MLLYAHTIFVSAFLLFLVQPVIAKKILPWFGGSAAVWTTCMLFFQVVLLLGYAYAHWSIRRLKPKPQIVVHLGLLALSLLLLPLTPNPAWKITGAQEPIFRILGLLATSVGLPYFLLATTGPLIQAWYARTSNVSFPYRLYALSNLGSMLALLLYPVAVEPIIGTAHQMVGWSAAYAGFVLLCAASAVYTHKRRLAPADVKPAEADTEAPEASSTETPQRPSRAELTLWMGLAACSSALLLAVTNYLCQDLASMPFLWILPLSLYLLSFVLCFDRPQWYWRDAFQWMLAAAVVCVCMVVFDEETTVWLPVAVAVMSCALFICCMFCHGELARRRPHAQYLTSFYLMISLGGALGGLFVALASPYLFQDFYELHLVLAAAAVLGLIVYRDSSWKYLLWCSFSIGLVAFLAYQIAVSSKGYRVMARNFYGGLRVADEKDSGEEEGPIRRFYHGSINHGHQFLDDTFRRLPTSYYGPQSGVGLAVIHNRNSTQRVGVIGLGTGTLAAYGKPGDYYRFYEINPLVLTIANEQFTYLKDSAAKVEVAIGDARLSLEQEPAQEYDVIAVDAFSGDSIPVHLLTREAFGLYFKHLNSNGVLAVHISNKYLDLEPVVRDLAAAHGKQSLLIDTEDGEQAIFGATWILITANARFLNLPPVKQAGVELDNTKRLRMWTDDYSNLFQIVKWD